MSSTVGRIVSKELVALFSEMAVMWIGSSLLGTAESNQPVHLVGQSNSGFRPSDTEAASGRGTRLSRSAQS